VKNKLIIFLILISNVAFAQESRTQQWQSDLTLYYQSLEKNHIDLFHQIDRTNFEKELDTIRNSVDQLSDWGITLGLMRLTRKIGDGHTAVSFANWETNSYPITVKKISNEWRVIKVASGHSDILGAMLESIDGTKIADIERKLAKVVQYVENPHSEITRIANYMPIGELLYELKITKSPRKAVFRLLTGEGELTEVHLNTVPNTQLAQLEYKQLDVSTSAVVMPKDFDFEYLWYTTVSKKKATYIRFDSYPKFEEMLPFVEKLLVFMEQNQSQQIVIDLRNNGGGDLYVGLVLANALNLIDNVDWANGVYVLTGATTFSAATSNAALFRQLLNAKIIGMPTGSNPTGYQDMGYLILPSSKLRITYSKRMFRMQETATVGVVPDIHIEQNWDDYSKGVDNVLEDVVDMLY
jgi:hypothetical protein